jgi:dTDP-4-amino-4,6-dideoxygalactose transaminase
VLRHGQYILGPEVRELETRLAAYTGATHCITVASGTEALLISLMALGIGPGDEVITTPFTFVATVEVIVLLGATPVFVDIEPDTCNIDARLIEAKLTDKTKAIMPVSLYGQPADMDAINAIAARHGHIPVIEDAAQSFGAAYKGNQSGNLSTLLVDDRPAVQEKLGAPGIPTAVHYPVPLNRQPAYAHLCCPHCTPVAQRVAEQVVSLPMHADLAAEDQRRIVEILLGEDG